MEIVMTDPSRMQLTDQLIQEVKEVLRQRISERQRGAVDPFTKEDISRLRHDAFTRGAPSALILYSAGYMAQTLQLLERALLPSRQEASEHP
jgi:hypothetical protein